MDKQQSVDLFTHLEVLQGACVGLERANQRVSLEAQKYFDILADCGFFTKGTQMIQEVGTSVELSYPDNSTFFIEVGLSDIKGTVKNIVHDGETIKVIDCFKEITINMEKVKLYEKYKGGR